MCAVHGEWCVQCIRALDDRPVSCRAAERCPAPYRRGDMSCGVTSCSSFPDTFRPSDRRAERLGIWPLGIAATARRALERRRQRKALLELDDRLLRDIGVNRDQALEEGRKPFWR